MKIMIIAITLLSLVPGVVQAGSAYDSCVKEEKGLKARETDDCNGLKYLLNPSGCFATRKKVKEFAAGQCAEIIRAGKPETVAAPAAAPVLAPAPKTVEPPARTVSQPVAKTESATPQTTATVEQLKEENARLKAEIGRLKKENEQLRSR
jgi:hypothetical protein